MSSTAERAETALGSGAMFDRIAHRYDLLNRLLSLGTDRGWRRRAVRALELQAGWRVLDLATGTADVAIEILRQEPRAEVVGLDPSAEMLAVGREKLQTVEGRAQLREGDAQDIPYGDDSFDGAVIAFGIRNVEDRPRALREMARVTRGDGRIVVLELTEPRGPVLGALARFHVHVLVPRLGALLSGAPEYRYLQSSIAAFPPAEDFARLMGEHGLEVLRAEPLTFGAAHLFVARPAETGGAP